MIFTSPPALSKGEGAADARRTLYSIPKPCSSSPLERVGEVIFLSESGFSGLQDEQDFSND